ncbi:N-acetylglutaminylglutamine synthetase [Azospirillum halopraeferens]|uniref:N-acetylglutaminylglutamine synthetase n=1 Tax=Azospirillum halopraeferens TaxID=34010 RepID=UPI0003F5EA9A|nr:N-acetylglutaminylglutamine synthetase [Azospirillum halopraeferens]
MSLTRAHQHRLERNAGPTLGRFRRSRAAEDTETEYHADAVVDCGWGRLIFAHTFDDLDRLVETLRAEEPGRRDIAFYLQDPHVALARAPQELFLDPSHTFRLWLNEYRPGRRRPKGYAVRRLRTRQDAEGVLRIYASRGMVQVDPTFLVSSRNSRTITLFVAVDEATGAVVGSVTGVDHRRAFGDPEQGSSLWCLAVDPQASFPGIGETLVRTMAEHFQARGRSFMDLSVLHDNVNAIALYEKLGFRRIPAFALKTRNSFNEPLFMGPPPEERLNPYATIIVNEARRRGIGVEVLDAEAGYFCLTAGGRSIVCRESLSELTTAVAMSRCDDKAVTRRVLERAELSVPEQVTAGDPDADAEFLARHTSVVVKPARGEQGRGITVDVRDRDTLERAVAEARRHCDTVLLERFCEGQDLRVIVIDYKVVAAAVRRPAEVTGTGQHSIRALIEAQSRRRAAATGGESHIPLDAETERCVRTAGYGLDDVLAEGVVLPVRKTANLHTGGTIHDVTDRLHPHLVEVSVAAARALSIPVVGFDLLVEAPHKSGHVFIEANERPGLANHEPQPTAERFVDLLFPQTRGMS